MPTSVAPGPGAGTGATAQLSSGSSDGDGIVTVNLGVNPTPGGVLFTVTFGEQYAGQVKVIVMPFNATAAAQALSIIPALETTPGAPAASFDATTTLVAIPAVATPLQYAYQVTLPD